MKILGLETSGRAATVATLLTKADGKAVLLDEVTLSPDRRTARELAPEIRNLLAKTGWNPQDVSLVGVSIGPGSFTGLRIGVTTAKTFAYATGAEVVGISTLDVVAEQTRLLLSTERPGAGGCIFVVAIPAERRQVFSARFEVSDRQILDPVGQVETVDEQEWLDRLAPGQMVAGPALGNLASRLPPGVRVVDSGVWQPLARTVGSLAGERFQAGHRDDVWGLVPRYHRMSAAEEKLRLRPAPRTDASDEGHGLTRSQTPRTPETP